MFIILFFCMKQFGISYTEKKTLKYYMQFVRIPFLVITFLTFTVFAFYHNVTSIVFSENKIDIFKEDLQQIAIYFWTIDRDFSNFLITLDDIVESYNDWENILITKTDEIEKTRQYMYENKDYLKGLWFDNYTTVLDFVADARKYKDELFTLLGKDKPQNYLVMLQNSNEKRPNGWFFGSFAFVTVYQARIQDLKIVDAYYPDYIAKWTKLEAPDWTSSFLPERTISFVAANKFWFTDMDGVNIKKLYELMFNERYSTKKLQEVMDPTFYEWLLNSYIKWVVFIQTDLLEFLIPWFTQRIWERQFVNASIDLIRWEERWNKKEQYISEVNDFFGKNQGTIIKNLINRFPEVLPKNLIHVYLSNVSGGFNGLIQKRWLTNVYSSDFIYARDTNDSYNKIDNFIQKQIQILNQNNEILVDTNVDKINIAELKNGTYTLKIIYTLNVPENYVNRIRELETKYEITLTEREETILWIKANTGIDNNQWLRWRSRSTIYFPPQTELTNIKSNGTYTELFTAPFAQWLFYAMKMEENNTNKILSVDFTINK